MTVLVAYHTYNKKKESEMELRKALLKYVGEFGRYQAYVLSLVFLFLLPNTSSNMNYAFFAATPEHWCAFPRRNDIMNLTEYQWKQLYIPVDKETGEFDSCKVYSWMYQQTWTPQELNKTLYIITTTNNSEFLDRRTTRCNGTWEYNRWQHVRSSVVTEWNLVCDRAWMKSMIASAFVIGWVVGAEASGYLSDRFGRRPVIIGNLIGLSVTSIALCFANHYIAFVIIRLLLGVFSNGNGVVLFTTCTEAVGTRYRAAMSNIYMSVWISAIFMITGVAYLLRDWFPYMLAVSVPIVLLYIPAWFLPESVVWLADKGHTEKATITLHKMCRWNKKSLPPDFKLTAGKEKEKTETRILDLVRSPNLCRITVVMCLNWFIVALTYYAVLWNTSELHGNLYINLVLLALLEIAALLLNIPLVQYMGRRWSLCMTNLLTGVLFLIALGLTEVGNLVVIMAAKMFCSMSFATSYQYTNELYPTVIRTLALSASVFCARVGTFIAPYLPLMGKTTTNVLCGSVAIVSAFSILLLPETMDSSLMASVQQAERHARLNFREILHCPCCSIREKRKAPSNKEVTYSDSVSQPNASTSML